MYSTVIISASMPPPDPSIRAPCLGNQSRRDGTRARRARYRTSYEESGPLASLMSTVEHNSHDSTAFSGHVTFIHIDMPKTCHTTC